MLFDFCKIFLVNLAQVAIRRLGSRFSRQIRSLIPFWHDYIYGSTQNEIADGGNDMFDGGNRVRLCFCNSAEFYAIYIANAAKYRLK